MRKLQGEADFLSSFDLMCCPEIRHIKGLKLASWRSRLVFTSNHSIIIPGSQSCNFQHGPVPMLNRTQAQADLQADGALPVTCVTCVGSMAGTVAIVAMVAAWARC